MDWQILTFFSHETCLKHSLLLNLVTYRDIYSDIIAKKLSTLLPLWLGQTRYGWDNTSFWVLSLEPSLRTKPTVREHNNNGLRQCFQENWMHSVTKQYSTRQYIRKNHYRYGWDRCYMLLKDTSRMCDRLKKYQILQLFTLSL